MLGDTLPLNTVDAGNLIDYLYDIFRRDFVDQRVMLNGTIWIDPRSRYKEDAKEKAFWHLTTRDEYEGYGVNRRLIGRYPDYGRAARLEWVKRILENHDHDSIRLFYHRETNANRDVRLYLWAEAHDFVVIVQKLGKSSAFLVTSFYVDHEGKRKDYRKRYSQYSSGADPALVNIEWF